jgi:hypothetical protein
MFEKWKKPSPVDFSTVILFSKLDDPFIDACIDGVLPVSNKTVLVAYDKLVGGESQTEILERILHRNRHKRIEYKILPLACEMVQLFPVDPKLITNYRIFLNIIRKIGFDMVKNSAEFTLFIDGDEIAEPEKLLQWKNSYRTKANSLSLANYFYFREPIYRADRVEYSPILSRNEMLESIFEKDPLKFINQPHERKNYQIAPVERIDDVLFHHYSWVRTKKQMLEKVKNWTHHNQRDWKKLVENEFARDFSGTDFVHGYKYVQVPNQFNLTLE